MNGATFDARAFITAGRAVFTLQGRAGIGPECADEVITWRYDRL